jgi:hypothetical protein
MHSDLAKPSAEIAVGLAPRSVELFQNFQVATCRFRRRELVRVPRVLVAEHIYMLRHLLKHSQPPMGVGDEAGMKRSSRRRVAPDLFVDFAR